MILSKRRRLQITVSASTIALGFALSSQGAQAADAMEQAYGPDWYVSVFGGVSFARAHTGYVSSQYDIKLKDGFSVGAAVGRHIGNGFRKESELTYVKNANKAYRTNNGAFDPDMNGDTASLFLFGNLWKDIRLSDSVQPYIGGGLGTGLLTAKESQENNWNDSRVGLAAQLGVGVRVALSDRVALDAGYRVRAVIDASLHSVGGDDNSEYSFYSHSAQLGLSYALGESSQILHGAGNEPSDFYVSVFAGGAHTDSALNYSNSGPYQIDHKMGFTIGGAVGTHIAPGLRTEFELSYIRSALDNVSFNQSTSSPASGHLEQGYLLGNIWKDFNLGMLTPYIGAGIGFGAMHYDNGNLDGNIISNDTGYGLAGQFGFGARMAVTDNLSVDLGYRFKSIVDASIIGGNDLTSNSEASAINHIVQLGVTYGLGEGGVAEAPAGIPDTTYVSLFGGGVFAQDTHADVDGHDYLVSFKTGFTVGAAAGENLTDNLRGEIELAYQNYNVSDSQEEGTSNDGVGDVKGYFVLANLWRDFDMGGFRPYAGGGIGMGLMDTHLDFANGGNHVVDGTSFALAAQVGSGVRFDVTDNMVIDVGYRFKAALDVVTDDASNQDNNSSTFYTHTAQVGVSWKF